MKELEHFFIGESCGGNQDWFTDWWMNHGGCAAVTACDCCIVLARKMGLRSLYPFDADHVTRSDFLAFGAMMRPFLHPRPTGVNKTGLYMDGFRDYLAFRGETGLTLRAVEGTEDVRTAEREIRAAIDGGFPVPYLMLLHTDKALEDYNWHWFLLNGYDGEGESFRVKAVTYGEARWLDFPHLWDTGHGRKGGFVVLSLPSPTAALTPKEEDPCPAT